MDTTTLDQKCIKDAEMDVIRDFVYRFRVKHGITPTPYVKMEQSAEAFGEGFVTLYQGLIPTTESLDDSNKYNTRIPISVTSYSRNGLWASLDDDDIRRMVLKQVVKDQYVLRK